MEASQEPPPFVPKAQLSKDERHTLILSIGNLLASMLETEIDRLLSPADKSMTELTQMLVAAAWKALTDLDPSLQAHTHLLTNGTIRNECFSRLGEFSRIGKHFPLHQRNDEAFTKKLQHIENAWKKRDSAKGKRKMQEGEGSALLRAPRIQAERSYHGAALDGAPPLFVLRRRMIEFDVLAPRMGEGAFAYASKCKVHDPNFPDADYVCKVIKIDESFIPKDNAAAIEATAVDVIHRGIVNPLGVCRDEREPMIIFKLWNGGNLRNWMWACQADGRRAPPANYVSISRDPNDKARFEKYVFHIINALMQTMEYMHSCDLLHNDFHAGNVFIHFSTKDDEVYAGIGDWGRSTRTQTRKHAVPLLREGATAKAEAREKWPWMAPETLSTKPPPFTKEQDIFSLGYTISRLCKAISFPPSDPKRGFLKSIELQCNLAMNEMPDRRPSASSLVICLARAPQFDVHLPRLAGLRPFQD